MKNYLQISDISQPADLISSGLELKKVPLGYRDLGMNKTMVLLFFNASLRTRLSTEKAAKSLGMDVIVLNANDAWQLEFEDGTVMDAGTSEHIKEAAGVLSQYADIIGVRAFPTLKDKSRDESDWVINNLNRYSTVPIVNLESATSHPLQALADALTIEEHRATKRPKVVLSWAPHIKPLPHAVANSFLQMMRLMDVDLSVVHPEMADLNPSISKDITVYRDQEEAFESADFIYAKNWCSYTNYGAVVQPETSWMITAEKLGNAKFMHCLPVRRNLVVADEVLDGTQSLVLQQANNRTFAAQAVLKQILEAL